MKLNPYAIAVVGIIVSDSSMNHGITIFNDWIFYAIIDHAIPYCREGLDFATCTKVTRSTFMAVCFESEITETPQKEVINRLTTQVEGRKM